MKLFDIPPTPKPSIDANLLRLIQSDQEANNKLACAMMGKAAFLAAVCDLLTVEIEKARRQVDFWDGANGEGFFLPFMCMVLITWGGGDVQVSTDYCTARIEAIKGQSSKDIALVLCREISKYF